ncbi:MAG: Hsp20/alpha crystallin family protein [Candidatus Nealsonbacteria bacterium]|nr:Hsp20/alpha crystallin family protein [Candidatus Nealsonbacteria bacterium]
MASFFEKLIGGQDQDQPVKEKKATPQKSIRPPAAPAKKPVRAKLPRSWAPEETEEEEYSEELEVKKPQSPLKTEVKAEEEVSEETEETEEAEEKPTRVEKKMVVEKKKSAPEKEWPEAEGQLAVDVYQTETEVVIESTIGGVKPENLEVTIENDMVLIRGSRQKIEKVEKNDYLIQECHWGSFSRQFVLPSEVDASRAEATLKDGVLSIRIPRIQKEKVTKLMIK